MKKKTIIIIAIVIACLIVIPEFVRRGASKDVYQGDENEVLIGYLNSLHYEFDTHDLGFSVYSPPPGDEYFSFQIADFNGDDKNELLVFVTSSTEDNYYNLYRVNKKRDIETKKGQLSDLVTNKEALRSQHYSFSSDHIELCENNFKKEKDKD